MPGSRGASGPSRHAGHTPPRPQTLGQGLSSGLHSWARLWGLCGVAPARAVSPMRQGASAVCTREPCCQASRAWSTSGEYSVLPQEAGWDGGARPAGRPQAAGMKARRAGLAGLSRNIDLQVSGRCPGPRSRGGGLRLGQHTLLLHRSRARAAGDLVPREGAQLSLLRWGQGGGGAPSLRSDAEARMWGQVLGPRSCREGLVRSHGGPGDVAFELGPGTSGGFQDGKLQRRF